MLAPFSPRVASVRLLPAAIAVVLFALAVGIAVPSSASADDADAPAIRWSVAPADESGADGRGSAEQVLDPGESADDHFEVQNVSDEEVTFRLTAADGFYTRTGRFDILAGGAESVDAGTWITLPDEVTVAAGEAAVVPYTITVPDQAEPGDHAAGITASVLSVQSADGGASVGVDTRVGFRVTTRVTGEITPAATLAVVEGSYSTSWNPLRPGDLTLTFDVVNEGNTRILAEGTVSAGGQQVSFPDGDDAAQELLPGDERPVVVVVSNVWPTFLVPTHVTLNATGITMDGSTDSLDAVEADTTVWAMPWPQLLVLAGLLLVIGAIVWGRVRSRKKLNALLQDAREEGRLAATSPADDNEVDRNERGASS